MAHDTRDRMILGAAQMIGTKGAAATSLRALARECEVPFGSTYHHFPGGKSQLVDEAVDGTGRLVLRMIERARADGLEAVLSSFAETWRAWLVDSDYRTGCPILAVATEDDDDLRSRAQAIFRSWQEALSACLRDAGVAEDRAPVLARLVISSLEGAVAVSRAERSLRPLEEVTGELVRLLDHERTASD